MLQRRFTPDLIRAPGVGEHLLAALFYFLALYKPTAATGFFLDAIARFEYVQNNIPTLKK